MTLGNIVKRYREDHKMSMDDFSNLCGLSKGYISMLEKNMNPATKKPIAPSLETIKQISSAINVDFNVLLSQLDDEHKISLNLNTPLHPDLIPIKTKKWRILGDIACGEPIYANEEFDSYIEAGADIQADFCVRAKGDSMVNARILDGDIVFIRKQSIVENGEIAAVVVDDSVTLKRFYKHGDTVHLLAENPAYEPQIYMNEELEQIHILGKAVAFQSDIK